MRLTLSWRSANGKIITFVDATCGRRLSLTNSACLTDNQSCLVENKIRTKVHNAAPQRAPFEFGHGDLACVNLAWVIWPGWPMQASVACMGPPTPVVRFFALSQPASQPRRSMPTAGERLRHNGGRILASARGAGRTILATRFSAWTSDETFPSRGATTNSRQ